MIESMETGELRARARELRRYIDAMYQEAGIDERELAQIESLIDEREEELAREREAEQEAEREMEEE